MSIEIEEVSAFVISPHAQRLRPVAHAPQLSSAQVRLLRELQVLDESGARRSLQLPVERPLSIVMDGQRLITLMTLGAQPEYLVLGYLRNQRIVERVTQIESVTVDWGASTAEVVLRERATVPREAERVSATACGLGSGLHDWMLQVDALPRGARLSHSSLLRIFEIAKEYDAVHRAAGSVHGCTLFEGTQLLVSIEDVSRHNGLDAVTGWMMLHGIEGGDKTLFTTGRLTGEMVMKAAYNGVPIMVSRNGVSSMGYELAVRLGLALFGRAAKGRYLCYTGQERFDCDR